MEESKKYSGRAMGGPRDGDLLESEMQFLVVYEVEDIPCGFVEEDEPIPDPILFAGYLYKFIHGLFHYQGRHKI
jgi:hypothetical protein